MDQSESGLIPSLSSPAARPATTYARERVVAQGKWSEVLRVSKREGGTGILVRSLRAGTEVGDRVLERILPAVDAIRSSVPVRDLYLDADGRLCALLDDIQGEPLTASCGNPSESDRRYLACVKLVGDLHKRGLTLGAIEAALFWVTRDGSIILLPPVGETTENSTLPISRDGLLKRDIEHLMRLHEELSNSIGSLSSRVSLDGDQAPTVVTPMAAALKRIALSLSGDQNLCPDANRLEELLLEGINAADKQRGGVRANMLNPTFVPSSGQQWGRRGARRSGRGKSPTPTLSMSAGKLLASRRVRLAIGGVVLVLILRLVAPFVASIVGVFSAPQVKREDEPITAPSEVELAEVVASLRRGGNARAVQLHKRRLLAFLTQEGFRHLAAKLGDSALAVVKTGLQLQDQYLWEVAFGGILGTINRDRILELHLISPTEVEVVLIGLILDLGTLTREPPLSIGEAIVAIGRERRGSSLGVSASVHAHALTFPWFEEAFPDSVNEVANRLSDAEIVEVLRRSVASNGPSSIGVVSTLATKVQEKGLLGQRALALLAILEQGDNRLSSGVQRAILRTALGVTGVDDVRALSLWPDGAVEDVIWTICLESGDPLVREEAFDLATRRRSRSKVVSLLVDAVREYAWQDRSRYIPFIGAVALQDEKLPELITVLDAFPRRVKLITSMFQERSEKVHSVTLKRYAKDIPVAGLISILGSGDRESRFIAIDYLKKENDISVMRDILKSYERERDSVIRGKYEQEFWFIKERVRPGSQSTGSQ